LEGKAKTPAESGALHGNQQRCHKQFSSFIPIFRL
jgi:hypothetical protein